MDALIEASPGRAIDCIMRGSLWTEADVTNLLRDIRRGYSYAVCAANIGRTRSAVEQRVWTIASQLFAGGHTVDEIATATGLQLNAVRAHFTPRRLPDYDDDAKREASELGTGFTGNTVTEPHPAAETAQKKTNPPGTEPAGRTGIDTAVREMIKEMIKLKKRVDALEERKDTHTATINNHILDEDVPHIGVKPLIDIS